MVASVAGVMEETGDSEVAAVEVSVAGRDVAGMEVGAGAQAAIPVRNTTIKP